MRRRIKVRGRPERCEMASAAHKCGMARDDRGVARDCMTRRAAREWSGSAHRRLRGVDHDSGDEIFTAHGAAVAAESKASQRRAHGYEGTAEVCVANQQWLPGWKRAPAALGERTIALGRVAASTRLSMVGLSAAMTSVQSCASYLNSCELNTSHIGPLCGCIGTPLRRGGHC